MLNQFHLFRHDGAHMLYLLGSSLVQAMACCLFGAKLLPGTMHLLSIVTPGSSPREILIKMQGFLFNMIQLKMLSAKWWPLSSSHIESQILSYIIIFITIAFTGNIQSQGKKYLETDNLKIICLAAAKQLYEWFSPFIRRTFFTLFPSLYHYEIFKSYHHWQTWCSCKRSRSGVKAQGQRIQTPI